MNRFYAKTKPEIETISEHTEQLLKRLNDIKKSQYPTMQLRDWELLEICAKYHDVGKADANFQNIILSALNEPKTEVNTLLKVRHNHLSVLAVPYKQLEIEGVEKKVVAQSIGYHHEDKVRPEKEKLKEVYTKHILPIKDELENHLGFSICAKGNRKAVDYLLNRFIESNDDFWRYIMIKGLLHRLDHSASASVEIELAEEYSPRTHVENYFSKKGYHKKDLQKFTDENEDNNLIVLAQTGMGKTEAALFWLGNGKGFLTLPVRTSLNAIYKRLVNEDNVHFSKIGKDGEEQALGLLHSSSLDLLSEIQNDSHSDERLDIMNNQTRNFANKLTILTIDQILKFAFLHRGFEKELVVLSGSKIVIDEMQAYDPKLAALIIRALYLINKVQGKFMIMTATMPKLYLKAIEEKIGKQNFVQSTFYDDDNLRHWLKIEKGEILAAVNSIYELGKTKKILVICNTVQKAKEMFEKLRKVNAEDVDINLLHSAFIHRDRGKKEKAIKDFADEVAISGIWITTQLVEASLDIDFDVLYTEMSPLDSLFQRFGRCNRQGRKPVQSPNVYVFLENASGVGTRKQAVYRQDIVDLSKSILLLFDNQKLLESKKMGMVDELYDPENLKDSEFKKDFEDLLEDFFNLPAYEIDKKSVQQYMRDIQQVQAIPLQIYNDEVLHLVEAYESTNNRSERKKLRRQINQFSLNVRYYQAKKHLIDDLLPNKLKDIFVINVPYDSEVGIKWNEVVDYLII